MHCQIINTNESEPKESIDLKFKAKEIYSAAVSFSSSTLF